MPSTTKQIGTTCGRPSRSTVARRATRASPISRTERIGVGGPLPHATRLTRLLPRNRSRRADRDGDPEPQPLGELMFEPRLGMPRVPVTGELRMHLDLGERG